VRKIYFFFFFFFFAISGLCSNTRALAKGEDEALASSPYRDYLQDIFFFTISESGI